MFKKKITTNDVLKINDRWKHITIPYVVQERVNKNAQKLANPQIESIDLADKSGKLEKSIIKTANDNIIANTLWASRTGVFLGIDLLTGNLKRDKVNDYIVVTTNPTKDFIAQWTGVLYVMGVTSEEECNRIAEQVIWQSVQTVNDNLILVPDYAEAFLSCNPRLRFKKRIR